VCYAAGLGAGAPAGDDVVSVEGQQQLLQEREWDRHSSKQVCRGGYLCGKTKCITAAGKFLILS
jgi:hypothetical protein